MTLIKIDEYRSVDDLMDVRIRRSMRRNQEDKRRDDLIFFWGFRVFMPLCAVTMIIAISFLCYKIYATVSG